MKLFKNQAGFNDVITMTIIGGILGALFITGVFVWQESNKTKEFNRIVKIFKNYTIEKEEDKQELEKIEIIEDITFEESLESDDYIVNITIVSSDSQPEFYNWVVTSVTANGFSIAFSDKIKNNNYELHWTAS